MPIKTIEEADQAITALQTTLQSLLRKDVGRIVLIPSSKPPADCLPCDGTEYDISNPAHSHLRDLFGVISNMFGGDGVTTFRVPELRGEFIRIWDDGKRPDGMIDSGRSLGSLQDWSTAMPREAFNTETYRDHSHGGTTGGQSETHSHSATASGSSAQGGDNTFDSGSRRGVAGTVTVTIGPADRDHVHAITPSGKHNHPITGGDRETRPRNVALAAYIQF